MKIHFQAEAVGNSKIAFKQEEKTNPVIISTLCYHEQYTDV